MTEARTDERRWSRLPFWLPASNFWLLVLRHEAQIRLWLAPTGDSGVLSLGALKVFEVLRQGSFIELNKELGLGGGVEPADVVDELTFGHDRFTFGSATKTGLTY